jgi:GTP-binding protein
MIEGYLKNSPHLSAVVVLLDSRRELDERDVQLIEWLRQYDIPVIYALTKIDKLNRQETERARRSMSAALGEAGTMVLTSATSGQGIKELWSAIIIKLKEPGVRIQESEESS